MKSVKSHSSDWMPFAGIVLALIVFYPELIFSKAASLMGDHMEQHYPWAELFARSLREGKLPFWTPFIHCGFPIAAESQIGIFYLPNLILYLLLPFKAAYAYLNVVHFFIAGWATYLYGRIMKLERLPAFTAAFIFLFGAAYGGAYYNITSLKTICWLPFGLFLFEKYYQEGRARYLAVLALIIGMSMIAGYLQVSALTWFIFGVYLLLRLFLFPAVRHSPQSLMLHGVFLLLTFLGALLVAAPQLFLTFELALRSNRTGLEEGYAYVGSLSPFALSTFIDPVAQRIFRGNSLYLGLFPVFLVLVPFFSSAVRKEGRFRLWTLLTLVSLLMALGQWSPLYIGFVKLTQFYSFRTPAKFIVFVCFGLSLLAGLGLQQLRMILHKKERIQPAFQAARLYLILLGIFSVLGGAAYYFSTAGKKWMMLAGEWFIRTFIYGQPGRPHSLEVYLERLALFPESVLSLFSFQEWVNVWTLGMILTSILLAGYFLVTKKLSRSWLIAGLIFLAVDLYGYAWFDIKRDFAFYDQALQTSPLVEVLKTEKEAGEIGRLYSFRRPGEELPLVTSENMLYGIEDIGAYSPLVMSRYHETIGLFGNIDDSNFAYSPEMPWVLDRLGLLNGLDVSHMVSSSPVVHPQWKLLFQDEQTGMFLYKNSAKRARAFFVRGLRIYPRWENLKEDLMKPGLDPQAELLLEQSELEKLAGLDVGALLGTGGGASVRRTVSLSDRETWHVENSGPGFFILMNTMYPGWNAQINGRATPILKAYGLFRAVWIAEKGEHDIRFFYRPFKRPAS